MHRTERYPCSAARYGVTSLRIKPGLGGRLQNPLRWRLWPVLRRESSSVSWPSIRPGRRQRLITAGENLFAKDPLDPPPVLLGGPAGTFGLSLRHAYQLGHRLGIARHDDFVLGLQRRLRLGPALPQISNRDRSHGPSITCSPGATQRARRAPARARTGGNGWRTTSCSRPVRMWAIPGRRRQDTLAAGITDRFLTRPAGNSRRLRVILGVLNWATGRATLRRHRASRGPAAPVPGPLRRRRCSRNDPGPLAAKAENGSYESSRCRE